MAISATNPRSQCRLRRRRTTSSETISAISGIASKGHSTKRLATQSRNPLCSPNPAFATPKITSSTVPRIVEEIPCTTRVARTAVMLNDGNAAR